MIRRIFLVALAIAWLPLAGSVRADEQSDYVLSRAAYVLGGSTALAGVHGLKATWHAHDGSGAGRTVFLDFAGGRMRMEWWKPGLSYGWSLGPKAAWAWQNERVRRLTPFERTEARDEFWVRGFRMYLGQLDSVTLTSLADRSVGEQRDHVIEADFPRGISKRLVFDGGTYYLKAIESGPDSAADISALDDYRDVGDFFLAHRETHRLSGGDVAEDFDLSVVQSKPIFKDSDFSPPVSGLRRRTPRRSHQEKP